MTNINIEAVINDLAEQVKKLTVDNAILRSALAQASGQKNETAQDEISASEETD